MRLTWCLSVLYAFAPQMNESHSLAMIWQTPELLLRIIFLCVPLVVCFSEITASEGNSNLIQHACIMFSYLYMIFSYQFTAQIFANMFNNNSTQRLASVATSISPLSDPRDNQFSSIHLRVLGLVLELAKLFKLRTKKNWTSPRSTGLW